MGMRYNITYESKYDVGDHVQINNECSVYHYDKGIVRKVYPKIIRGDVNFNYTVELSHGVVLENVRQYDLISFS